MSRASGGSTSALDRDRIVGADPDGVRARQDRDAKSPSDQPPDAPALVGLEEDLRREPRLVGGADQQFAQPRPFAVADELLMLEVDHPDLPATGERVVLRQHDDELLHQNLLQRQAVALDALGDGQESEVEHVDAQHLRERVAVVLANGQLDLRMQLMEARDHQRDIDRPHRVHRPERHVAGLDPAHAIELLARRFELGQHTTGPRDQQVAGVGDRDPPRGAFDERQAELLLELLDLLRERGLGDVLPLRRTGEALFVGKRDQVPELAQFHSYSLYVFVRFSSWTSDRG